MKKLLELTGGVKFLAMSFATFATCYSALTAPDINLFYSIYFAGLATGVALTMLLDDEE